MSRSAGIVRLEHEGLVKTAAYTCADGTLEVTCEHGFSRQPAEGDPAEQARALFSAMLASVDVLRSDREAPS
jgi:hypothetical protein